MNTGMASSLYFQLQQSKFSPCRLSSPQTIPYKLTSLTKHILCCPKYAINMLHIIWAFLWQTWDHLSSQCKSIAVSETAKPHKEWPSKPRLDTEETIVNIQQTYLQCTTIAWSFIFQAFFYDPLLEATTYLHFLSISDNYSHKYLSKSLYLSLSVWCVNTLIAALRLNMHAIAWGSVGLTPLIFLCSLLMIHSVEWFGWRIYWNGQSRCVIFEGLWSCVILMQDYEPLSVFEYLLMPVRRLMDLSLQNAAIPGV